MANYPNTPVMSQIQLPSGNSYYLKDGDARDAIDALEQAIAGGVSFIIAWDGTSTPVVANIPAGVKVTYNNVEYTGTLATTAATSGAFYLVKSSTSTSGSPKDVYDEYVVIKPNSTSSTWFWEKIGDTQIDLSDVVTGVTLNKSTATLTTSTDQVIGADATFTITQPTVALALEDNTATGRVGVLTHVAYSDPSITIDKDENAGDIYLVEDVGKSGITATASGGSTSWNSKDSKTVLTGVKVTTQPSVGLTANNTSGTGRIQYVESISSTSASGTSSSLTATATDGAATLSDTDIVTALTGLGSPSTNNAISGISTSKLVTTSVTGVSGSTSVTGVSGSTSVTGVQSSTTTASKATADTSQTTINLTPATTSTYDSSDGDVLMGAEVSNEVLILGAYKVNTQTTTQFTFSDVTVPIKATSATTVPKAASSATTVPIAAGSATTVATGALNATASGATVATGSSGTFSAVTGYPNVTSDDVLGEDTTITVTQPTISLSQSEVITAVTGGSTTATTKYLSATASGTAVGADGTATVVGTNSTFTNNQPTITLATAAEGAGDIDVVTAADYTYIYGTVSGGSITPTTKYIQATASGANTAWNNKDTVNALTGVGVTSGTKLLTDSTTITVTKGQ